MARLIILGATGSLGGHVLRQALTADHQVTALVRTPSKLPLEAGPLVSIHTGDLNALAPADLAGLVSGHDALIDCAGHVTEGEGFFDLIDRVVTSVELLLVRSQPDRRLLRPGPMVMQPRRRSRANQIGERRVYVAGLVSELGGSLLDRRGHGFGQVLRQEHRRVPRGDVVQTLRHGMIARVNDHLLDPAD